MRITRISGENIASLSDPFELDFRQSPLNEDDLFAITGPTGSGKSTLLDVICLALYDKTPRMSLASRDTVYADVSGVSLSGQDSRIIMHKGAASCRAEVSFVVAGTSYTSRYTLKRARMKVDGKLQASEITLTNDDTGEVLGGKKRETLEKIEEILGLNFTQFTRAVMLAQGQFATFLLAADKEKSDILMRITGTEIYKLISKEIYARHRSKEEEVKALERSLAMMELPQEGESERLMEELSIRAKEKSALEQNMELLRKELTFVQTLESSMRHLQESHERWQASNEQMSQLPQRVAQWEQWQQVARAKQQQQLLSTTESSIAGLERERIRLEEGMQRIVEQIALVEQQKSAAQSALQQLREGYLRQAPALQEAKTHQQRLNESVGTASALEQLLQQQKQELQTLQQQRTTLSTTLDELRSQLAQLQAWHQASAPRQPLFKRIPTLLHQLEQWQLQVKTMRKKERESSQLINEIAQLEKAIAKEEAHLQQLKATLPQEVWMLRSQLHEGAPCPVCGSIHHTVDKEAHPDADTLSSEDLQAQQQQSEQALMEQRRLLITSKEKLHQSRTTLSECEQLIAQLTAQLQEPLSTLLNLDVLKVEKIDEMKNALESLQQQWETNLQQYQSGNTQLQVEEARQQQLNSRIQQVQTASGQSDEELRQLRLQQQQHKSRIEELLGVPAVETFENAYQKEEQQSMQQLLRITEQLAAKQNERNEQLTAQKSLESNLQHLRQKREEEAQLLQQLTQQLPEPLANYPTIDEEQIRNEQAAIEQLKADHQRASAIWEERQKDYQTLLATHPQYAHHTHYKALEELPEPIERLTTQLNEKQQQLEVCRQQESQQQLRLIELQRMQERHAHQLAQLSALNKEHDKWLRLNDIYGSADGEKFNTLAQGFTLERLVQVANKHLRLFLPRYQLFRIPKTLALDIVDLDMMEQHRPVSSLSGGETFLVSLSLSIALSELSAQRMNIETLFIDEGFGSLDHDAIMSVLDALERLKRTGRKIGIISHVKEITEGIAVKVQLLKKDNGRSILKVTGRRSE